MRKVSRFEANLLRLLHYFLRHATAAQAMPVLESKSERPRCLSRDAVELVKDALAKGCVTLLTRLGGWRRERQLRGEQVVEGRLWERTPPKELALSFSPNTLDFLIWLATRKEASGGRQPPVGEACPRGADAPRSPSAALTVGDLLLFYFAHSALRGSEILPDLLRRPPFAQHGLCWLAFPDDFAKAGANGPPDFVPWTAGVGACIIEALQPVLAGRWLEMEVDKARVMHWQTLRDLGRAQQAALDGFLTKAQTAGRLDLARFVLMAAARLATDGVTPKLWTGGITTPAPRLADRSEMNHAALAFLHQLPRMQQWEREARGVGYFDDGYQASQLYKADWERFGGDAFTARAQDIIRQLDPMRQTLVNSDQ